jgi:hypothetical protein
LVFTDSYQLTGRIDNKPPKPFKKIYRANKNQSRNSKNLAPFRQERRVVERPYAPRRYATDDTPAAIATQFS